MSNVLKCDNCGAVQKERTNIKCEYCSAVLRFTPSVQMWKDLQEVNIEDRNDYNVTGMVFNMPPPRFKRWNVSG